MSLPRNGTKWPPREDRTGLLQVRAKGHRVFKFLSLCISVKSRNGFWVSGINFKKKKKGKGREGCYSLVYGMKKQANSFKFPRWPVHIKRVPRRTGEREVSCPLGSDFQLGLVCSRDFKDAGTGKESTGPRRNSCTEKTVPLSAGKNVVLTVDGGGGIQFKHQHSWRQVWGLNRRRFDSFYTY